MCVTKRLEPIRAPSVLNCKSWDNLPQLKMGLNVERDPKNSNHHYILEQANHMKITLIGAYNLVFPYDKDTNYMAATRLPIFNENVSAQSRSRRFTLYRWIVMYVDSYSKLSGGISMVV